MAARHEYLSNFDHCGKEEEGGGDQDWSSVVTQTEGNPGGKKYSKMFEMMWRISLWSQPWWNDRKHGDRESQDPRQDFAH